MRVAREHPRGSRVRGEREGTERGTEAQPGGETETVRAVGDVGTDDTRDRELVTDKERTELATALQAERRRVAVADRDVTAQRDVAIASHERAGTERDGKRGRAGIGGQIEREVARAGFDRDRLGAHRRDERDERDGNEP